MEICVRRATALLYAACVAWLFSTANSARAAAYLESDSYVLSNGLTIILHEDHRSPFVAVRVRYRVGALHEYGGRSGLAHLFEHVLFRGTEHLERQTPASVLAQIGATHMNGETGPDHTDYYEVVPSVNLETALWLEADRMGFPTLSRLDLGEERRIVHNERRQHYEIQPYGLATLRQWQALFPAPHPYHQHVIGSHSDLEAIQISDIEAFFRRWYVPSNAILTLAGDFTPEKARAWIQKYFSTLPSRPRPPQPEIPEVHHDREIVINHLEAVGALPQVSVAWLTPPSLSSGDTACDILALLLKRGPMGRLRSRLIPGVAITLSVEQRSLQAQSVFRIVAETEKPDQLPQVVAAIDATLSELAENGVTDEELSAARIWLRNEYLEGLENSFAKTELLSSYQEKKGKANWFAADLIHHQMIGGPQIQSLIREYFGKQQRVVLYAVPPRLLKDSGGAAP